MSQPPEWIASLADQVSAQIIAVDFLSPVGCHFHQAEDAWEISLFASQTEILGGPQDGSRRPSRFHLDLKPLLEIFESVDAVYWQAHGLGRADELGPHVGVEGRYQGHQVWLRVLAHAPRQFPPGRRSLVHQGLWEELW